MTRSNDKKHIRVNVCKSKFVAHNITNAFALVLQIFGKALCINGRIKMNRAIDGQLIYKDLSTVNMFRKFFFPLQYYIFSSNTGFTLNCRIDVVLVTILIMFIMIMGKKTGV